VSDKPIPFSAPMIRALLDGRKTQTRCIAKFVKPHGDKWHVSNAHGGLIGCADDDVCRDGPDYAPYAVGDRLWVREAWRTAHAYDDLSPSQMGGEEPICFEADGSQQTWGYPAISKIGRLRPGMFMMRWMSRMTLVVTDVRVQRLQEISRDDAIAEGIDRVGGGIIRWENWSTGVEGMHGQSPQAAYALLWNHINGADAWQKNPWVAAYTLTVHKSNIDALANAEPRQ
jgi:hypothetical protein